jgi:cytochrome c2
MLVLRPRTQGAPVVTTTGATEDPASGRAAGPGGTDHASPNPPGLRSLLGAFLAALFVVVAAGCGTGGLAHGGDANRGKKLFVAEGRCGGCHTLKDARSTATVGPNLDDAFAESKAENFKLSTIQNVVLDQIRFPTNGSGMPANLVKGQDAKDVSAYVARCAAADPKKPADKAACPGIATTGKGGQGLYASLGCQGCHSIDGSKSTGPTFKGLYGSKVTLTTGQTVTADDQYLLEAIIDPDKEIVKGYQPGVMTSVIKKGQIKEDQAKQLVDFIKKQK